MTAMTGANHRRSDGVCQAIDEQVKVMSLEETPAVLALEKLCKDHGCTYHWSHLIRIGKRIDCKKLNCVPFVVRGLSASSSSTTPSPTSPSKCRIKSNT